MSDPEVPSWVALLTLMVHGPDGPEPSIRGAIRSTGTEDSAGSVGWVRYAGEPLPVFAGAPGALTAAGDDPPARRVWRAGVRTRIEEPDRFVSLIVGDTTCWQFDREH